MQRFTFRYVSKPHSQQLCVGQPSAAPVVLLRLLILVGLDLVAAARETIFRSLFWTLCTSRWQAHGSQIRSKHASFPLMPADLVVACLPKAQLICHFKPQEHGKGRMNSSAEQGDACALVCSQQQRCLGIPAKAQLQESSHDYCEKAAPAKVRAVLGSSLQRYHREQPLRTALSHADRHLLTTYARCPNI